MQGHPAEKETIEGARGALYDGMRIHSVRLPGLVAHQEVILVAMDRRLRFVTIRLTARHLCQAFALLLKR